MANTPKKVGNNDNMKVSDIGKDFLMGHEAIAFLCPDGKVRAYDLQKCSCRKTTKKDKNGNILPCISEWTVGIGEHSGTKPDTMFNSVDDAITSFRNRSETGFASQVREFLRRYDVKKLRQNEFDAFVDLCYQGPRACRLLILKFSQQGTLSEQDWVNATGSEHVSRRKRDYNLFSGKATNIAGVSVYELKSESSNNGYCANGYKNKNIGRHFTTPSGGYDDGGNTYAGGKNVASVSDGNADKSGSSDSNSSGSSGGSNPAGSPTVDTIGQQKVDLTAEIQAKLVSFSSTITNNGANASFKPATEGEVDKSDSTGVKRIIQHT